ncbi:MAG: T9SS type A sorting domain-containing protein [Bacteroidales bacterium]|nr:T9SS type A sorting domain-containing protein [Bacteroidales bacterium]
MKKLIISLIVLTVFVTANAQTWTNYYDGNQPTSCLSITDSLIFVAGEMVINVYTTEGVYRYSKLADEVILCSDIDNYGNVWFGCSTKILKFDGNNWTSFNPNLLEPLMCTSLRFDKNNKLWASLRYYQSYNGLISTFDGNNWQNISSFGDTISISYADEIVIDTNNVVYVGINVMAQSFVNGVVRISESDTTIFHYANSDCTTVCRHSSYLDNHNNVWFGGCYNKLTRFDGTNWYSEGDAPELHNKAFDAIYKDITDNLWLGTNTGLFVQNEDSWIEYTAENELKFNCIGDIKSDLNDNIWMAAGGSQDLGSYTKHGCLIKHDETGFSHYYSNTFNGKPSKVVFRNDETWVIGTGGVSVLKDGIWQINNIDETIEYGQIKDIEVDANNNIWMISASKLYKIDTNNNLEVITNILGHDLINNRCLAKLDNNVWLNLPSHLFKFNGESWLEIDITDASATYFNTIQPVSTNEIWAGTDSGALHYDGSSWTTYTTDDGLGYNTVRDIAIEDNKVWFATGRGVSVFDGSDWITYIQGTDPVTIQNYNNNSSIFIDENGHKWIGCSKGLYRYDNDIFEFIQPNDIDDRINYITEDLDGNIWVAGVLGLSKYTFEPNNIEQNIIAESSLELFPNPAGDFFQIELDNLSTPEVLKIYTVSGKCIHNQTVYSGTNTIKTNDLQPGIYIVRLTNSLKFAKLAIE